MTNKAVRPSVYTPNSGNKISGVNWNKIEDEKDKEVWDKLVSFFWLPEKVALSNDLPSWRAMTDEETWVTIQVFSNLTMLDTIQGTVGAVQMIDAATTPQEEAVLCNISFMEAFVKGTQLLTSRGWKNIEDVVEDDLVAQFDPKSGRINFVSPQIVPSHYEEEIYEIATESGRARQVVSGGHRVMVREGDEVKAVEARDLYAHRIGDYDFIVGSEIAQDIVDNPLIELYAALRFGADYDGGVNDDGKLELRFNTLDDANVEMISDILDRLEWSYEHVVEDNQQKIIVDDASAAWCVDPSVAPLAEGVDLEFSATLLHHALRYAATLYDGEQVYLLDDDQVEFLQACAVLSGKDLIIHHLADVEEGTIYDITISDNVIIDGNDVVISRRDQGEDVYCVQVPSTYLVTRYGESGNTPVVSGNCVHAKSYSNIFMTLASTEQINAGFSWVENNEYAQEKARIILDFYNGDDPFKIKIASTLLESFLFYSGFFWPLYLNSRAKLTNTNDIIRLIIRDESIHGYYIGYKYQKALEQLSKEQQEYYKDETIDLLLRLYENEEKYTEHIYDEVGLTNEVKKFLRYNANKALNNLGYDGIFPVDDATPMASIMSALAPAGDETSDFFSGSGSAYQIGTHEETDDDDWDF